MFEKKNIKGSEVKIAHALKNEHGIFLLKKIHRIVAIFIASGEKMINKSLVGTVRFLTDPQPHPLLNILVRMKLTSTTIFLQGTEM